jgi:hypothetical protein
MIAVGIGTAVLRLALLPLDWDGWAIWQLKARAMVAGDLRRVLTLPAYHYDHPDYPLLVPTSSWWLCGNRFSPKLAQAAGFLFFLDLLAQFYAEAVERVSRFHALAGLAVMLSWAPLVKHSASGFADVPMAAFDFATLATLLSDELWLAVPMLAGGLLAKNEGVFTLVGALLVTIYTAASAWPGPGDRRRWMPAAACVAAGAVTVALWGIMKRRWHLAADLLDPSRWPPDLTAALPERVGTLFRGFAAQAFAVGPRYPGWGVFWPLAGFGLVVSILRRIRETTPFWLFAGAHFAGVFVAYLLTPLDPGMHMAASIDRLWLQAAPVALLAVLMVLNRLGKTLQ